MRSCPISSMLPYRDLATRILSSGFWAGKKNFSCLSNGNDEPDYICGARPAFNIAEMRLVSARWQQILHKDENGLPICVFVHGSGWCIRNAHLHLVVMDVCRRNGPTYVHTGASLEARWLVSTKA
ncbi:uncharacterized protein LOC142814100 [Rhipicephalus microplus]|uniref:uncharacterized protein LOC142814100 n=1 Tax=Rhipicephalus microplus TaxID=6941 RepID=UPI003F6C400D